MRLVGEMFVECTGLVGSGKSTLCSRVVHCLKSADVQALSFDDAITVCLKRWLPTRLASRVLPGTVAEHLVRVAYFRVLDHAYALYFSCQNPRLAWHALKSQWGQPVSLSERLIALARFFRVAGRYRFLRSRLRADELVMVDEGLVHRAVTLYAGSSKGIDRRAVLSYLRRLPAGISLVVVHVPRDLSLERAIKRGLPSRLQNRDRQGVAQFMDNSQQIVAIASAFWAEAGRLVIEVDNSGPPGDVVSDLCRKLADAHSPTFGIVEHVGGLFSGSR